MILESALIWFVGCALQIAYGNQKQCENKTFSEFALDIIA